MQHARQVAVLGRVEVRRTSARNPKLGLWALVRLHAVVGKLDDVATSVRSAFAGLVESVWIEEYLATRIEPLREERDILMKECNIPDLSDIQRLPE